MNPTLRASVAHLAVDDVTAPALDDRSVHHLVHVLRAHPGEPVTVTDGRGGWRACVATSDGLHPDGEPQVEPADDPPLTVAVAVPKADRPEWIVRKLTEIGVDRLVWLECRHSVVRWDATKAHRMRVRFARVAVDASLQSRRVWFPVVGGPVPATQVLGEAAVAEPGGRSIGPRDRSVAIGPEGGWDQSELVIAPATVDLGPTVLRVETAALVAAAEMVRLRSRSPSSAEL